MHFKKEVTAMTDRPDARDNLILQYPKVTLGKNTHIFNDDKEIELKIGQMRNTTPANFRALAEDILGFLAVQVMKTINIENANIWMPTLLLEPMMASGETVLHRIDDLKNRTDCADVAVLSILAAPQGVDLIQMLHPEVQLYIAHLDDGLNWHGYIIPGFGENGNLFGSR